MTTESRTVTYADPYTTIFRWPCPLPNKKNSYDTNAHARTEETSRQLRQRFIFPRLRRRVRDFVGSCSICASCKRGPLQQKVPLRPRPPTQPWETVFYEAISAGNRFIVVTIDLFSRWTEAIAFPGVHTDVITPYKYNLDDLRRTPDVPIARHYQAPRRTIGVQIAPLVMARQLERCAFTLHRTKDSQSHI